MVKQLILPWLLHHANRDYHGMYKDDFYKIKNAILKKYGRYVGFDLQIIEGKKCFTCNGTGIYVGYYWDSGDQWEDTCNNCCAGWYKLPKYVLLSKIKFGKYLFHQPKYSYTSKNEVPGYDFVNKINGYIEHSETDYSEIASKILFLIYDFDIFKLRYIRSIGVGFYTKWWLPRNWINNLVCLYNRRKFLMKKTNDLPF